MRIVTALFCLASASLAVAEEPWNQFRGPHENGISHATGLPVTWSETENVQWKTPIHGKGWSSPVVWGDQIWLTTAPDDGKQLFAMCIDRRSGKVVHDIKVFDVAEPRFCHPRNTYASCTPIIEEGRIYVHFGSYGTACLNTATGEKLWERRDLECDHFRAPGSSPILEGDLLYLNFDGVDVQYVVALDKNTGKTVWQRDRGIDYGTDNGDRKKAYGTPRVIEVDGRKQLVSPAAVETVAYDPNTGDVIWRVRNGGMNAAARPLYEDGLVFINSSGGFELYAVRPDGKGDVTESHVVWKANQSVAKRSSQIFYQGHIYMVSDEGIASCLDAKTGETKWRKRFGGTYWSSPILADGRIYSCSEEGVTHVFAPNPEEYTELAANELETGCMGSPAVAGKSLILRTKTHLYSIGEGKVK